MIVYIYLHTHTHTYIYIYIYIYIYMSLFIYLHLSSYIIFKTHTKHVCTQIGIILQNMLRSKAENYPHGLDVVCPRLGADEVWIGIFFQRSKIVE